MDARNKDKCKQCGRPDHGTAACNTVDDDRPVYNEAMDTIEKLKQALDERDKEIERLRCFNDVVETGTGIMQGDKHIPVGEFFVCPTCILKGKALEQAEARVSELEKDYKLLETQYDLLSKKRVELEDAKKMLIDSDCSVHCGVNVCMDIVSLKDKLRGCNIISAEHEKRANQLEKENKELLTLHNFYVEESAKQINELKLYKEATQEKENNQAHP